MTTSVSTAMFGAQLALLALAFVVGRMLGQRSAKVAETSILLLVPLAIGWAVRSSAADALVRIIPLDVLVYTEGTLILPVLLFVAGALTGSGRLGSQWSRLCRIGPLLAVFGVVYFVNSARWMVLPTVRVSNWAPIVDVVPTRFRTDHAARSGDQSLKQPVITLQSNKASCVAAALATALSAEDMHLRVSESEMAALADVKQGVGSTMLRALRALRDMLVRSPLEPTLMVCTAADAARMASIKRPVIVALRSGPLRNHMVVVYGMSVDGDVILANPWRNTTLGAPAPGGPEGLRLVALDEFARLYQRQAIAFVNRADRAA